METDLVSLQDGRHGCQLCKLDVVGYRQLQTNDGGVLFQAAGQKTTTLGNPRTHQQQPADDCTTARTRFGEHLDVQIRGDIEYFRRVGLQDIAHSHLCLQAAGKQIEGGERGIVREGSAERLKAVEVRAIAGQRIVLQ